MYQRSKGQVSKHTLKASKEWRETIEGAGRDMAVGMALQKRGQGLILGLQNGNKPGFKVYSSSPCSLLRTCSLCFFAFFFFSSLEKAVFSIEHNPPLFLFSYLSKQILFNKNYITSGLER